MLLGTLVGSQLHGQQLANPLKASTAKKLDSLEAVDRAGLIGFDVASSRGGNINNSGCSPPFRRVFHIFRHTTATRSMPFLQQPNKLRDRQPRSLRVNHAMAVGAYKGEVRKLCLVTRLHFRNWHRVVALNEAFPSIAIGRSKVEVACFAVEARMFLQELLLFVFDNLPIALSITMNSSD